MENKENILDELTNFEKRKPKDIPAILEDYLIRIAKTGDTMFPWIKLKPLFMFKMEQVMAEFYESCPTDDIMHCPNVDRFTYDLMKEKLLEAIDNFSSAPFTIQRLCELVTAPRKHYKHTDKFMRGLEKNVLVVSTVEPGCSHIFACDCARKRADHQTVMMNGMADVSLNGVDRHSDEPMITDEKKEASITADVTSPTDSTITADVENGDRLSEDKKSVEDDKMNVREKDDDNKDAAPESEEIGDARESPDKTEVEVEPVKSPVDSAVSSTEGTAVDASLVAADESGKCSEPSRKRGLDEDEKRTGEADSEVDSRCKRGKMPSPPPTNDVTQSCEEDGRVGSPPLTSTARLMDDDQTSRDSEGFEAAVVAKADSDIEMPVLVADPDEAHPVATTTTSDAASVSISVATTSDAASASISVATVTDSDNVTDDEEINLPVPSADDECGVVGVDDDEDEITTTVTTTETVPVRDEDDNAMDVPTSDNLPVTTGVMNSTDLVMPSTSGIELEAPPVDGGGGDDEPMDED